MLITFLPFLVLFFFSCSVLEDLVDSLVSGGFLETIVKTLHHFNSHTSILKNCCIALGNLTSHSWVCLDKNDLVEVIVTVMTVLQTQEEEPTVQESCVWAIANLSHSVFCCDQLLRLGGISILNSAIGKSADSSIQDYLCWTMCNIAASGLTLSDIDALTAMGAMIRCLLKGDTKENILLQEHVCHAVNVLIATKTCVHECFVESYAVTGIIRLMRRYEDNIDIQVNSVSAIGNLAVNDEFRYHLENEGSSEVVISSMLYHDRSDVLQLAGCMTLSNISANLSDNKYRVLKNGGTIAALQAMKTFKDHEAIHLSAVKLLSSLTESAMGCWAIVDECGTTAICKTIKRFIKNQQLRQYGCNCLGNLPRKGMDNEILISVMSTLTSLHRSQPDDITSANGLCVFYENLLKTENAGLFDKNCMETVLSILRTFEEIGILTSCCRVICLLATENPGGIITRDVVNAILHVMQRHRLDSGIQTVCCGTISFITTTGNGIKKVTLGTGCIEAVLEAQRIHLTDENVQAVTLMALEYLSLETDSTACLGFYAPDILMPDT